MGDPTGVGPEILIKSLSKPETYAICRPLAVGSVSAIERMAGILGSTMRVRAVDPASAAYVHGTIEVYDPWGEDLSDLPFKQVTVEGGRSSAEAVIEAAKLVMAGRAAALVTGPIHKEAINRAGYHYAGHTELLADLTGTPGTRMLLVAPSLRVIHNSTHVSLREAIERVTHDNVLHCIRLLRDSLQLLGFENPRIAVNGLNPHAGEDRLFGDEDADEIAPRDRHGARRRHRRDRPGARGHGLQQGDRGALRRDRGHVSRPGPRGSQDRGVLRRHQCLRGHADHPHQRGPRHGLWTRGRRPRA